ncbi:MAG TPA: hypothetical protein VJ838_06410 [Gaiellaceae bacterium]|nr:hypothetical protein [Gaiellaceae bacterium]
MRGRFPIPRSRRGLLVAGAALAVVLGGAAAGLIVALSGANGGNGRLTRASFAGYGFEFRYPSEWQRVDWCWLGTSVFPLVLLTNASIPPRCQPNLEFGSGTPLPPPQRLGRNGVSEWWFAADHVLTRLRPNATLGGEAARITVRRESTRRTQKSYVNCSTGATQQFLTALIHGPSSNVRQIEVGAVVCGPDFAAGLADVRKTLDGVRFTG